MKLLLNLTLLGTLLCGAAAAEEGIENGALGSRSLTEPVPYMASIRTASGTHHCSGTLIHPRVVLTTAHCIRNENAAVDVDIGRLKRIGEDDSGFLSYTTVDILVHESYDPANFDYDIALLILNEPCPFNPLTLASTQSCFEDQGGCSVRLLGFGNTENTYFSSVLQEFTTLSVKRSTCQSYLGNILITSRMICAEEVNVGKINSCRGDSGSPLIQNGNQVGINGFGVGCGDPHSPGVYTSVPKLRSWIDSKLTKL